MEKNMYLKEIELKNFRNYKELSLSFHERVNIITGNNAQGKTNLLESLYIMSLGKSFRTSRDSEMIAFGETFSRAKSKTCKDGENLEIEIVISKEGKSVKIDGVKAKKTADLLECVYMVVFSPEDLKIVKDEPERRRKFLDRELCQLKPVYYKNLGSYKKVLQNRNILLRRGEANRELFSVYDEKLAEYGSKIIWERLQFVKKIDRISRDIHGKITNEKETFKVSYEGELSDGEKLEELGVQEAVRRIRRELLERLQSSFRKDLARGSTGAGPHRDDLRLEIDGVDIRHYGSQGQQRTAALSLKLAEIYLIKQETGEDAILLLDDVLSELDIERQTFLLNRLKNVQIFITTAELSEDLFSSLSESMVFFVEKGTVKRLEKG